MAETWNATFDIKPNGTDTVGTMDDFIKATRQAVRERVEKEHLFDFAVGSQQGLHKMGSARVWTAEEGSEPVSPIPTGTTTETAGNEGEGRLLIIVDSSGNPTGLLKQWVGTVSAGSWVPIGTSTETPNAIVVRDASGNFAANMITSDLTGNASTATNADKLDGQHSSYFATASQGALANSAVQPTDFNSFAAGPFVKNMTVGETWIPGAGMYLMSTVGTTNYKLTLQTKNGTSWYGEKEVSGLIVSDGTNVRISNTVADGSIYYFKVL